MSELRDRFDRLAAGLAPRLGGTGDVRRRAQRRARNRRVAAGAVAGAIALGGAAAAWTGLRGEGVRLGAPQPGPAPTLIPTPRASLFAEEIEGKIALVDASGRPGLATGIRQIVEVRGFSIVAVEEAEAVSPTTAILHRPGDGRGARKAEQVGRMFFSRDLVEQGSVDVGADVTVVLGSDLLEDVGRYGILQLLVFDFVLEFSDARIEGEGAEEFLSPFAAVQFDSNEVLPGVGGARGVYLYEQPEGPLVQSGAMEWEQSNDFERPGCDVWPPGTCEGADQLVATMVVRGGERILETWWVGFSERDQQLLEIRAVHAGRPPMADA